MTITQDVAGGNESISTAVSVTSLFQPIFSVRDRKMIGVESCIRGYRGISSEEVTPDIIFKDAARTNSVEMTDRILRKTALESFSKIPGKQDDFLLFLNLHPSIISQPEAHPEHLWSEVKSQGIDPYSVVIEIVESDIDDIDALSYFVQRYRHHGFLIALDKIGDSKSNLERIPLIKPDIVKIDKEMVSCIDEQHHKQEVAKALVMLAHHVGALTVALGIDRKEEALSCLETGFDLLQGGYFSDPVTADNVTTGSNAALGETEEAWGAHVRDSVLKRNEYYDRQKEVIKRIAGRLETKQTAQFPAVLRSAIRSADFLQCLYVIDDKGTQVSPTVTVKKLQRKKHYLFGPAPDGTDHSLKDYILKRSSHSQMFISDPYVSKATGKLCVTASEGFCGADGKKYLLCIDLTTQAVHTRDWL